MWRFKPFMQKESAGLEGRTVDVSNIKIQIRNAIAEGGFSCVYLARDAVNPSKLYALKHVICQDRESLDLVMKEISVLKLLKGHPNVVTLVAHTIFDMGRTKEALLVMEFCEKSLVSVLENRGAGYFEEKKILLIFRDVCNAVFAMHCQSPPIAHRDLKAENVLFGANGVWKLCDFGSTSTNHKRFDRPEEMGIEEDNIRKHTTPAYRAPEMWDLYRRELISEKVDIWALGCLLYRICYLKSAFDGESKLQVLNGSYHIPELPKYSASITSLIKDMLEASPDARPDITQVWFRVNELLPEELQKDLPDGSPSTVDMHLPKSDFHDEAPKKTQLAPRRSPPPPPSSGEHMPSISPSTDKETQSSRYSQGTSKVAAAAGGGSGSLGAFWSTQHSWDSQNVEDKGPVFDEEPINHTTFNLKNRSPENKATSPGEEPGRRNLHENSLKRFNDSPIKDFEISFSPEVSYHSSEKKITSSSEGKASFQNQVFDTFVAEFDTSKIHSGNVSSNINSRNRLGDKDLEAEVARLREELKQANLEKVEMTSKFEKLSAICRSQRHQIQELKHALTAATPSLPTKGGSEARVSPGSSLLDTPPREKIEGTVLELQQGMLTGSPPPPNPDPRPWQAFIEDPKMQSTSKSSHPKSVRTVRSTNGDRNTTKQASTRPGESWGFEQDSFKAVSSAPEISRTSVQGNSSQRFGDSNETKKGETNRPAGWAGF